jgi:hypothetical protein
MYLINGAITSEITSIYFIKIFIDGPDVFLNELPNISPKTATL